MTSFTGWPPRAVQWFEELEANNTKEYFKAHRDVYDADVLGPLQALTESLREEFGEFKIFRPYRDVRFSKDKSPYRTSAPAVSGTSGTAVYYLEVSSNGLLAASGYHGLTSDQLQRFRAAVDDDESGTELERIVGEAQARGYTVLGETLKGAPRGYSKDHPRLRFLQHKDLTLARRDTPEPEAVMHTPAALDFVAETWRGAAKLNTWFADNVGSP